jgi:hypothetical protein
MAAPIDIRVNLTGADRAAAGLNQVTEACGRQARALEALGRRAEQLRRQGVSEAGIDADPIVRSLTARADAYERLVARLGSAGAGGGAVRQLGDALRAIPALDRVLPLGHLREINGAFRLIRMSLGEMGPMLARLGLVAGGAFAAYGTAHYLAGQAAAPVVDGLNEADRMQGKIAGELDSKEQSGALRAAGLADLRARFNTLVRFKGQVSAPDAKAGDLVGLAQNLIPQSVKDIADWASGVTEAKQKAIDQINGEITKILRDIRERSGVTYGTEDAAKQQAAQQALAFAKSEAERERSVLRTSLELQLRDRTLTEAQKVAAVKVNGDKLRQIIDAEADAERRALDVEKEWLAVERQRPGVANDKDAQAKIAVAEKQIEAKRQEINARQLASSQEQHNSEALTIENLTKQVGFMDTLKIRWNEFKDSASNIGGNSANAIFDGVTASINGVSGALAGAIFHAQKWGQVFENIGEQIVGALIKITLEFLVAAAAAAVLDAFTLGAGGPVVGGAGMVFANGGRVPGYADGGPTGDSMLARVSPGEWVTRASAVQQLGTSFLAGINQGTVDLGRLPAGTRVSGAPSSGGNGAGGAATQPQINLHFHSDHAEALKMAMRDPSAVNVVVDSVRQNLRQIS